MTILIAALLKAIALTTTGLITIGALAFHEVPGVALSRVATEAEVASLIRSGNPDLLVEGDAHPQPDPELMFAAGGGSGIDLAPYRPDPPQPPNSGNVIILSGGNHELQSNTTYMLDGDVGILRIRSGVSRVAIEGRGFASAGVTFPAQWAGSPEPKCWDIRVSDLRRVGGLPSAFLVYGERILLENVRCEEQDIPDCGVYSWGGRHITLRDSYLHTQGNQAATRWVACEHIAVYRCHLGTPTKHSMRVHASGADSRWILWAGNVTTSPWYIGYQDRPNESLIADILILRNRYVGPPINGNNSWFQHAPSSDPGGPKLMDFSFVGNIGPGTMTSQSNLNNLGAAASPTWLIAGNVH